MKLTIYTTPEGLELNGTIKQIKQINKTAKELAIELNYRVITKPAGNYIDIVVDKDEFCYRLDPTIIMRNIKLPNEIEQVTQGDLFSRAINILTSKLNIGHATVAIVYAMDGASSTISTGMDMYQNTYTFYPELPKDFKELNADILVNFGIDSPKIREFPTDIKGYIDFTSRVRKISTDVALINKDHLDIIAIELLFEKIAIFDTKINTVK